MPLTLADVFLGLGSGFGGTGFCRSNLNHTNTETVTIINKKKEGKRVEKITTGSDCGSMHFDLVLSFSIGHYLQPGFASDGQIRRLTH